MAVRHPPLSWVPVLSPAGYLDSGSLWYTEDVTCLWPHSQKAAEPGTEIETLWTPDSSSLFIGDLILRGESRQASTGAGGSPGSQEA